MRPAVKRKPEDDGEVSSEAESGQVDLIQRDVRNLRDGGRVRPRGVKGGGPGGEGMK